MTERIESQLSALTEAIDREFREITVAELEAMNVTHPGVTEPSRGLLTPVLVAAVILVVVLAGLGAYFLRAGGEGDTVPVDTVGPILPVPDDEAVEEADPPVDVGAGLVELTPETVSAPDEWTSDWTARLWGKRRREPTARR